MSHAVLLAVVGFVGGTFGSMVGLGGGVFIIPALTLFLGVPIHAAISASLVAVVATSTAGSITYVRQGLTNFRVAVTVETALTAGALTGGFVGAMLDKQVLSGIFGGVMVIVSVYMALNRRSGSAMPNEGAALGPFGSTYYDPQRREHVRYHVRRMPFGVFTGLVAGNVSGLLGVGGGFLTVPVMRLAMGMPMRAAVATSSLMLGVTACAGAIVYFAKGLVDPTVAVPVVLGVTAGAVLGSRIALKVRSSILAIALSAVLFILSIQMILAAAGISLR
jgi:uncharacterized membrane protein YfcA